MRASNHKNFLPLFFAIGIVLGILVGSFYASRFSGYRLNIISSSSDKINDLLHVIDDEYVDDVDISELVEKSLPQILKELDPHSTYIRKDEVETAMQELNGYFSGVGIQFMMLHDTVNVTRVIAGGPAEGCGILPGDRIIATDDSTLVGKDMTSDKAMKRLKGPANSVVKLKIFRPRENKTLDVKVVRGAVPLQSIDAVFMLDRETGYVRVKSFAETTYAEFVAALARLETSNFKKLVIDLRGNLGGYMQTAVQMANEFLPKGRLIVYTQGRTSSRDNMYSDGRGAYQNLPLTVLVDETSASASEIFAGAMQDNDRGTIVGRRTFGKGLVQVPIEFRDGSLVRLTKSRYYTPSGRCLQKPYTPGDNEAYENDFLQRENNGELFSADSIKHSDETYKTVGGRIVYGGGGIIPDVFVPIDTLGWTSYYKQAVLDGLVARFAYEYADRHRAELENKGDALVKHLKSQRLPELFATYAEKEGLRRRHNLLKQSYSLFERAIIASVVTDIQGVEEAARYLAIKDKDILKALNR